MQSFHRSLSPHDGVTDDDCGGDDDAVDIDDLVHYSIGSIVAAVIQLLDYLSNSAANGTRNWMMSKTLAMIYLSLDCYLYSLLQSIVL